MAEAPALSDLARPMLSAVEQDLRETIDRLQPPPPAEMRAMVDHHLGWSEAGEAGRGKRLRPLLTLLSCAAAGGDWRRALPAASAVEWIHNFSLVHDDIQDASERRRGRPSLWKLHGMPLALNAGDAMLVLARLAAHRLAENGLPERDVLRVLRALDEACLRLTLGQHEDLVLEREPQVSEERYTAMIVNKTAALLAACTGCGALLAGAPQAVVDLYRDYGRHLGLAFQALDDLIGAAGDPQASGKPSGDDLAARKKTLPVLYGLQRSAAFRRLWESSDREGGAVQAMAAELRRCGALAETQRWAAGHTRRALHALAQSGPASPARAALEDLTHQLLRRTG
jgi:geranylgeranyl diphosphate synthase type I